MRRVMNGTCLLIMLLLLSPGCRSQQSPPAAPRIDRQPAAAGGFYPGDPAGLKAMLKDLFARAKPGQGGNVVGVICPHAGYTYSGVVAASSFNQVDPDREFDNIFIIGSSHRVYFMGASVYNQGDYITPLGKVPVNTELANQLIKDNPVFSYQADADRDEHCVEVEIPFLQYHMKKPFRIVPIVLGTQSEQTCKKIANALKPYFNGKNLFVFSTDFSHYPPYQDAVNADRKTCDAIVSKSPDNLLAAIKANSAAGIPNLATSLCGWTSILTLLYLAGNDPSIEMVPVYYMNSGDVPAGDKSQVVGYWSIALKKKDIKSSSSDFSFTMDEKKVLLEIARQTIEQYIRQNKVPQIDPAGFTDNLKMQAGAFVTLKENGELRGCIGRFTSEEPLYRIVQEMAIASATEDTRFTPVSSGEIDKLEIEISVLSPMKKISSIDEIELGKHGIYIKKGYLGGTFLPQVATETGWNKEEFLGHCARDKAGIGWDGWKTADIYIYEASVFSEGEVKNHKE